MLNAAGKFELAALPGPGSSPVALPAPATSRLSFNIGTSDHATAGALEELAIREGQRNVNLTKIATYAEEQTQDVPSEEVSEDPVALDWINKWRESAQDVTDDHMQKLWGRILAEEVKKPGSYRMRTLDFLRTLDKQDALKVAAIGPFVLDLKWIHRQDETFRQGSGPTFDDLLELQDMGILAGVGLDLKREYTSASQSKFAIVFSCDGKAVSIERQNAEPPFRVEYYRLTALGQEVLRLGDYVANDEYMKRLGRELKRHGLHVKYGDWIRKPRADSTWGRLSPDSVQL